MTLNKFYQMMEYLRYPAPTKQMYNLFTAIIDHCLENQSMIQLKLKEKIACLYATSGFEPPTFRTKRGHAAHSAMPHQYL